MIDINKKYRTRGGLPVRILCVDAKNAVHSFDGKIAVYPVVALVSNTVERLVVYSQQGRFCEGVESEWDLVEVNSYADFKVDDKVLVRDGDHANWLPRHFSHVDDDGFPCTFQGGSTSWSNDGGYLSWKFCKKAEE